MKERSNVVEINAFLNGYRNGKFFYAKKLPVFLATLYKSPGPGRGSRKAVLIGVNHQRMIKILSPYLRWYGCWLTVPG
jgi:hypothetical protein